MEYRVLGKTGLEISRLGFGGIPIQKIDAEGTRALVGELVKKGINFIDTARGYTVSEEYLGYALEGVRDKFVLATKSMARTKEKMAADVEISLRNLRTDHIDLYQIHNPSAADLDTVTAEGGIVEVALDQGFLQGGGRVLPLCEVEVELKEGTAAVCDRFADTLASRFGLTPEPKSKFARALALRSEVDG